MELNSMFQSVLDQDTAPVVLCDLNHVIVYMNPAAVNRYAESGGAGLIGRSLFSCHNRRSCELIEKTLAWFAADRNHNRIYEYRNEQENKDVYIVALRGPEGNLTGYYEKHEYRNRG